MNKGSILRAKDQWICCQIGAREHYAVPRIFKRSGRLGALITDAWAPACAHVRIPLEGKVKSIDRWRGRFHHELKDVAVRSGGLKLIANELQWKLSGVGGWDKIIARNDRFESYAESAIKLLFKSACWTGVFSYSYAAERIFRHAKAHQMRTILGQIDAGPYAESIYDSVDRKYPRLSVAPQRPPTKYWEKWRRECDLADVIIANSIWTKEAMIKKGISEEKVVVIPLAYEFEGTETEYRRVYPKKFTNSRPLRVLYVGSVSLTKGIGELLEAAERLAGQHIQFILVGRPEINLEDAISRRFKNVIFVEHVARSAVASYMRDSDLFVFPTHSDGFGLVQLEAQAHALPIIASRHCGNVVEDGRNGVLLPEISGESISNAILWLYDHPNLLQMMSNVSEGRSRQFTLDCIRDKWDSVLSA